MPPKYKKAGANTRDRRHENGLAPPAKQIKRQKSDGLLNGHVDLETASMPVATTENPLPSIHYDNDPSGPSSPRSSAPDMFSDSASVLASVDPHLSLSSLPYDASQHTPGPSRAIAADLGDQTAQEKGLNGSDTAPTIIAPWSVVDIIAILMVLMQLPSSIVTLVNVVFAFLTFGPPPASWSASSVASASEWLQSHGGNPSFVTMVFLDFIFLGLWSLAPSWGKDVFLDFSQAVVAISLGGCSSGVHAKLNGLISVGVICVYHLLSRDTAWRNIPLRFLAYVVSLASTHTQIGSFEYRDVLELLDISPEGSRNWPRILLEIHIVTQGVVRVLRRSLVRTSVPRTTNKKSTPADSGNGVSLAETPAEGVRNSSTDGRPPGPSPSSRESRERNVSSGKKRRKQATFVRSQQPFWAAIASTKVTVTKEIEQSQSSRDSFDAGANGSRQLGSASLNCLDDSVWVSDVHDTEIWFSATLFGTTQEQPTDDSNPIDLGSPGLEVEIRVNGAEWSQISSVWRGSRDGRKILTGKIFGLTPLTNYQIEFSWRREGSIPCTVNLLTRPHASLEEIPAISQPLDGSFRPSSPLSTLRNSISAAEATLADHRSRSKKMKKDHKSATNALRREVDVIENRLSSWSGNDERQRQRQIQFRQNIKQAEDSFDSITSEIECLGEVPEEEMGAASESQARFKEQERAHDVARDEMENARTSRERQMIAARAESAQHQQKHERLAARLSKLNSQRESLVAAAAQDSRDQHQRDLYRLSEIQARVETERSYSSNIQRLRGEREALVEQQSRLGQQIAQLEASQYAYPSDIHQSGPQVSVEGSLITPSHGPSSRSGANGSSANFAAVNAFAMPSGDSRRGSVLMSKTGRARSSSMLSNVSGYTDDEIEDPRLLAFPNGPPVNGSASGGVLPDRQGSTGSAGSTQDDNVCPSRPGSRPATTSPKPKVNPIGAGRASPRSGLGLGFGK